MEPIPIQPKSSRIAIWIPVAFCFFLSLLQTASPSANGTMRIYGSLTIAFMLVGIVHLALLKRVETLEAALRKNPTGDEGTTGA